MPKIQLLLGSNLGNRAELLDRARVYIEEFIGEIIAYSPEVETAPVGYDSPNNYLNQIVVCTTELAPIELLDTTQEIERKLGRVQRVSRDEPYTDRPIDIDILYYYTNNGCIPQSLHLDTPRLTLPHPEIQNRQFVLDLLSLVVSE